MSVCGELPVADGVASSITKVINSRGVREACLHVTGYMAQINDKSDIETDLIAQVVSATEIWFCYSIKSATIVIRNRVEYAQLGIIRV